MLSSQKTVLALMHIRSNHISVLRKPSGRAGWTIGQTGQMPGASRLNVKTFLLMVFHIFRLFTTRQKCRDFWLLRLVYRLRKLTTLALIVFEWLKRIEANSTTFYDPRIRSKSVHPWASAEIFPMKTSSKYCLSFSGCWRCNANGRSQNALPFLAH